MTLEGPQVCPLWTLIIRDRSRILEIPEGGGGAGWSWWPVHAIRSGHTGDKIGRMWGPSRFAFGGLGRGGVFMSTQRLKAAPRACDEPWAVGFRGHTPWMSSEDRPGCGWGKQGLVSPFRDS